MRDEAVRSLSDLSINRLTRAEFAARGVKYGDIVDSLDSRNPGKPLSAKRGAVLEETKQGKLSRSVRIDLASIDAATDTGGDITPGVRGILPVASCGTGRSVPVN
jgi:hypothetical protein